MDLLGAHKEVLLFSSVYVKCLYLPEHACVLEKEKDIKHR